MFESISSSLSSKSVTYPLLQSVRKLGNLFDFNKYKLKEERRKYEGLYEIRKQRIMDTIFMDKEPDRVPVIGNGINFFPAKYAGISCKDYMYDFGKLKYASTQVMSDFDLDMYFMPYFFALGRVFTSIGLNLYKLPGRDIDINSGYQFNEFERMERDEYKEFNDNRGEFLFNKVLPRTVEMFQLKNYKFVKQTMMSGIEFLKYLRFAIETLNEMKIRGAYSIFGSIGFPPYDIMCFMFRTLHGLSRDLMKRDSREHLIEIMEWMNDGLISMFTTAPALTGLPGVWFPSERAFSLSPRQFKKYYWPTLKEMIIKMVESGQIPFLTWEGDVTHLVHHLLELPNKIARRCVFNCDTSDIFEVNKILDGHMCIAGNIPLSTMCVGTPKDVEKYCEKLFLELKPNGGFMLSPALGIPDEAKPENVHAMINYAHKHGHYK